MLPFNNRENAVECAIADLSFFLFLGMKKNEICMLRWWWVLLVVVLGGARLHHGATIFYFFGGKGWWSTAGLGGGLTKVLSMYMCVCSGFQIRIFLLD